ncbi:hypothetical protein M5X11_12395 [Paenibacillus alginolyticus]|nr:hypothetical protein [Paenibacillus alginolyticus]MCY9665755.1 hypothetical protein [Paenibacillus alginolyticus]
MRDTELEAHNTSSAIGPVYTGGYLRLDILTISSRTSGDSFQRLLDVL